MSAVSADGCAPASPTTAWLAAAPHLPVLDGPAAQAERLLLLIHYGIDWRTGWVGAYRATYWEKLLADRVVIATYRCASLRRWWREVSAALDSAPRSPAQRGELAGLLNGDDQGVLEVLRTESEALVLRVRIVADAVRAARTAPAGAS